MRRKELKTVVHRGRVVDVTPSRPKPTFGVDGTQDSARPMKAATHDDTVVRKAGVRGNDRIIQCLEITGMTPKELWAKALENNVHEEG